MKARHSTRWQGKIIVSALSLTLLAVGSLPYFPAYAQDQFTRAQKIQKLDRNLPTPSKNANGGSSESGH